jgi:hypothetical protein
MEGTSPYLLALLLDLFLDGLFVGHLFLHQLFHLTLQHIPGRQGVSVLAILTTVWTHPEPANMPQSEARLQWAFTHAAINLL